MPRTVGCLIEAGAKRTFAIAVDWPGWCRADRDEPGALASLHAYGPRYAAALDGSGVRFAAPRDLAALSAVEHVAGNATTDFGAPDGGFEADLAPVAAREWARLRAVLEACWRAFDRSVSAAEGVELRKGPRGGGRELGAIVAHVVGAEASYLRKLTAAGITVDEHDAWAAREPERAAVLEGLGRAEAGELPERGPRGGAMWAPRRFLRRAAWHVLDHAWEIEDRATA
jgi:hypothetical protein